MERFIVTGASGYVGRKVMRALGQAGHTAIGFDVHNADINCDLSREFPFPVDSSYQNTHLIHLAAMLPGSESRNSLLNHSSQVSQNLLKWSDNFDRSLVVSSTAVYKTQLSKESFEIGPWEAYGQAKLQMERDFSSHSQKLTILRPGTILGPDRSGGIVDLLKSASKGKFVMLPRKGHVTHPFVHVDDVVESILRWAQAELAHNLGVKTLIARDPISLFDAVLEISGIEIQTPKLPDAIFRIFGSDNAPFFGISKWHLGALLYDVQAFSNKDEKLTYSMVDTIRSVLTNT
jgi:nucleoside-diphosphate-sugar epimerase